MSLDDVLLKRFTVEEFSREFLLYKALKTDIYTKNVLIPMGVDGVDYENFDKNLRYYAEKACKRVHEGKYFFSPFRELDVPKPPYVNLSEARKNNKVRTLSIATIRDVIFQKLLYNSIEDFCEKQFNQLGEQVSFAYRKGKSAPLAVSNIYSSIRNEGFLYALDGDIKKFFDEIPHDKLYQKLENFFGVENTLTLKYLKRFFSADRVEYSDYHGNVKKYYNRKPKRKIREKGIPQGGVLSGLIANIYLHDFDTYVVKDLYSKYDYQIKYFRYADDFLVLFKNDKIIGRVFEDIRTFLQAEGLIVHDIGEKTKVIDMSSHKKGKVEFLGFEISSKGIGVKQANIQKFKNRVIEIVESTKMYKNSPQKGLKIMVDRLRYKILGNYAFEQSLNICELCGKERQERNWLSYFLILTDVRILRSLDVWLRKVIYRSYFNKTGKRLRKSTLKQLDIPSLERLYYKYKRDIRKEKEYCHCIMIDEDI